MKYVMLLIMLAPQYAIAFSKSTSATTKSPSLTTDPLTFDPTKIYWDTSKSDFKFDPEDTHMAFYDQNGKLIVTIARDGAVELFTAPNEAAKVFWKAVISMSDTMCRKRKENKK